MKQVNASFLMASKVISGNLLPSIWPGTFRKNRSCVMEIYMAAKSHIGTAQNIKSSPEEYEVRLEI